MLQHSILDQLTVISHKLTDLQKRIDNMAINLDALASEVSVIETVQASAVALIQKLTAEIQANLNDPAALQALVDKMKASTDALASAVAANTPAVPVAPVVDPVPVVDVPAPVVEQPTPVPDVPPTE
jgi:peptidoglycan hydrolase CwlO-like protein